MKLKFLFPLLSILLLTVAACTPAPVEPIQVATPTIFPGTLPPTAEPAENPTQDPASSFMEGTFFGLTYQREDGNRLVDGQGDILNLLPIRIQLPGEAEWLVAVPYQGGSLWTVVLRDGEVVPVLIREGQVKLLDLGWDPLPAGTPPLVLVYEGSVSLIGPPTSAASQLTHPTVLRPDPLRLVFADQGGDLVLLENGIELERLNADVLPDARILVDEDRRALFLSLPTDRYDHSVLGDGIEAGSITLVETEPELRMVARIEISAPAVVEGIVPIWADLDGDGKREILVTVSDPVQGARLVLYSENGELLARGPAAGQSYRWRHQLAAAPLDGGPELVVHDVLRPHLDALFEVYRWNEEYLTVMEYIPGYSSHPIGSRNLDQTLVGDLDGDGFPEVVVPASNGRALSGLFYREGALGQAWMVELGGRLSTNLAGVSLPDGKLALGVGVEDELIVFGGE